MTFKYLHLQWGPILMGKLQILCPQYFQASLDLNCPAVLWGTAGVYCMYHTQQSESLRFTA